MTSQELKDRTRQFALRIVRLAGELPHSRIGDAIGRQVLRTGTSVGSNYRAACRARSRAGFVAKLGIVEEETDEVHYWLEIMEDAELMKRRQLSLLHQEAEETLSIIVASIKSARRLNQNAERMSAPDRIRNPESAIRNPQAEPKGREGH